MGSRHFVLVDAGFNDLMRPAMYGSYHHISLLPADGRDTSGQPLRETVIAGPLCESGDVFTQQAGGGVETREPPPAQIGDYLVFHDTAPTAHRCPPTTTAVRCCLKCCSKTVSRA